MAPVVRAQAVSKRWGATAALQGASFEIQPGITGLLGSNGAGKTTLLGLLLGMHRPDEGQVEVLGRDPWTQGADLRARVGYAPEHEALPEDVRAYDIVRHLTEVHGLPSREAQTRASDALYEVGLGEERFRPVGTMSTGQRQRVKLAVAIAHDPELVLLDEPTNGLDPMQRDSMLTLVRKIGHELGLNVILCSHLLEEVERVSDAVVILDGGRVVRSGPLTELRRSDANELMVEVDGGEPEVARLVAALVSAGVTARADGALVAALMSGPTVFDLVRDALDEGRFGLRRLEQRTSSLEEVFLSADAG